MADKIQKVSEIVSIKDISVIFCSLLLGDITGMDVLKESQRINPDIPVVIMTSLEFIDPAIKALKNGAFDYILKPLNKNEILAITKKALEQCMLKRENQLLKKKLKSKDISKEIIGSSAAMHKVFQFIDSVSSSEGNILITGESGTGKSMIAQKIHDISERQNNRLIKINCGAIPPNLLESELFGYKKGAFTSATKDKDGLFKAADNGTIFLDEISELPLLLQTKLLYVVENMDITPVGGTTPIDIDVRIITASNVDLEKAITLGKFREDLFYRLNVLSIKLPPLREREEDILPLAELFIGNFCTRNNLPRKILSNEALQKLLEYEWPGNVREMENMLQRTLTLHKGETINANHLPVKLLNKEKIDIPDSTNYNKQFSINEFKSEASNEINSTNNDSQEGFISPSPAMEEIEKAYIYWVLENNDWNKSKCADILGFNASTLYRKIDRYKITRKTR